MKDRIIEIYALKIDGETKSALHHFVNPGIPIPKQA
ncbi:MAG: 3'-5' exonuclease, partial [Bacteroidetes bacterium]